MSPSSNFGERLRAQRRASDRRIFDAFPESRVATTAELIQRTSIPPHWVSRVLNRLVYRGCVSRLGGGLYQAEFWYE